MQNINIGEVIASIFEEKKRGGGRAVLWPRPIGPGPRAQDFWGPVFNKTNSSKIKKMNDLNVIIYNIFFCLLYYDFIRVVTGQGIPGKPGKGRESLKKGLESQGKVGEFYLSCSIREKSGKNLFLFI